MNQNKTYSNNMLGIFAKQSAKISNELNSTFVELIFAKVAGLL